MPVVQGCAVRRAPISSAATSFYRSDCDAGGGSSGGMNLARVGGELVFRGMTISTGPWRDSKFVGAPYNEKEGSVTTALGTDAAILAAAEGTGRGMNTLADTQDRARHRRQSGHRPGNLPPARRGRATPSS